MLLKFRICRHARPGGQTGGLAHAAQSCAGGFHDKSDDTRMSKTFAVVVRVTINLTKAGNLQSHAELHRFVAKADARASFCDAHGKGEGIIREVAGVEGPEPDDIERIAVGLMCQNSDVRRILGENRGRRFGFILPNLRIRIL